MRTITCFKAEGSVEDLQILCTKVCPATADRPPAWSAVFCEGEALMLAEALGATLPEGTLHHLTRILLQWYGSGSVVPMAREEG